MNYYEVLVATMAFHGNEALTYAGAEVLEPGVVVRVSLRNKRVLGIVARKVSKPSFDVKEIDAVAPYPAVPKESLELMRWLGTYYPAPLGSVVRQFVPGNDLFPKDLKHESAAHTPAQLPPLTAEQAAAVDAITGPGTFLLHGITGSGKSRIYVELAQRALEAGKSAIVLTPEIGLTPQLAGTFRRQFGASVHVLHSQLTAAQRRDSWYRIVSATTPQIIIGPRSALFSPLHNVGLIVLDESHDTAYKNESAPHYQATRVAAKLANLHGASLVLGSATPAIEDYFLARERGRPILELSQLAKPSETDVQIHMVDLRKPELFVRSSLLSDVLIENITAALKRGEQALLFLNRRGTANVVLCNNCGWQSLCPNCDLSLTYHGDAHELRCHVCGFTTHLPTSCPVCENTEILFKSIGTKAVMDATKKIFPTARIQRFDTDVTKAERLEQHLSSISAGSADILVGTQMLSKGLDLPKLAVVGILRADSSLLIPDYTAAEQTYQLISQVTGRVGRGHTAGHVIVQTYDPENPTLHAALTKNWQAFYDTELAERRQFHYPPFTYLLKLRVLRASSKSAQKAADTLATTLQTRWPKVLVEGPTPSFHPRESGKYSWQLLLKSQSRQTLIEIIRELPSGWGYDIDPANLL